MSKTGGPRRINFGKIQARQAEKAADPVVLEIGDLEITVPAPGQWQIEWQDALVRGDLGTYLRQALGDDGYSALMEMHPTNDDISALITELVGATPGESSGSSSSSTSTTAR